MCYYKQQGPAHCFSSLSLCPPSTSHPSRPKPWTGRAYQDPTVLQIKILLVYKLALTYRDFNVSPIEITKYRRLPKNHRSKSVGNSVFCPKHLFLTAPSCLNQLNSAIPTYNLEWNHFGGKAIVVYRKSSLDEISRLLRSSPFCLLQRMF